MNRFNRMKLDRSDRLLLLFIGAIAAWRVLVGVTAEEATINTFTPIGAMALFGGAYFSRGKALILPLLTLWLSDILMNRLVFYGEWVLFYDDFLWTYGAFALMTIAGRRFTPQKSIAHFAGSAVVITLIHWIVTDIGVWYTGLLYPMTPEGLWLCLVAAIPYEINLLMATLLYGAVMFGCLEWTRNRFPRFQEA